MHNFYETFSFVSSTRLHCDKLLSISTIKVVMQGKLIAVAYTLRTIETSSLWAEFVNENRCISVRLVSEEVKSIKFW